MSELSFKAASEKLFRELHQHIQSSIALKPREFAQFRRYFTAAKSERSSGYMNVDKYLSAYVSFYLPVHLPEVFWILEQNKKRLGLTAENFSSVLDLGSGPGTATLSLVLWMLQQNFKLSNEIKLMDQSRKALKLAAKLLSTMKAPVPSLYCESIHRRSLRDLSGRNYKFVMVSHFLNEIGSGPSRRSLKEEFLAQLSECVAPDALILLIEPPLREPTMDLMRFRDSIQQGAMGDLRVLAPCPTTSGLCPMLAEKKGWCYTQPKRESLPRSIRSLDPQVERIADIELTHPGYSYLLIGNPLHFKELQRVEAHRILTTDRNAPYSLLCEGEKFKKEYRIRKEQRGAYLPSKDP